MSLEVVRASLASRAVKATERVIDHAVQFRLTDGEVINVYSTDIVAFQGRPTSLATDLRRELADRGARLSLRDRRLLDAEDELVPDRPGEQPPPATDVGRALPEGIPDGFSPAALDALSDRMRRYREDLIREASRLEEGDRVGTDNPAEITATHVSDADRVVRRPRVVQGQKPSALRRSAQVAQVLSVLLTGAMLTLLHSGWQDAICAAAAVIAILSTIYVLVVDP